MQTKTAFRKTGEKYFILETQEYYPSVTTILNVINKPALLLWAAGQVYDYIIEQETMPDRKTATAAIYLKRDKAASVGSTMHSFYEAIGNGARPDVDGLPEEIRGYGQAFMGWMASFNPTFIKTEHTVWSKNHKYAGTADAIVKDQSGATWLIDFKTSKGIYDEHGIQLSAYKHAIEEKDNITIHKQAVVQLKPDGTFVMQEFNTPLEVFLGAKKLWGYLNGK